MSRLESHIPFYKRASYPAGFFLWVNSTEGRRIWADFQNRALQMAQVRRRYSAMAIGQVIRWDTAIRGGDDFKLNNNWIPGLARLWLSIHGKEHPGFFQLRDSLGRDE
jgi:hypothetical protein